MPDTPRKYQFWMNWKIEQQGKTQNFGLYVVYLWNSTLLAKKIKIASDIQEIIIVAF